MHPFIIIGGVIVMAVTAAIGIPQVISWVDSGHDNSAKSDLSQIATVQGAAHTVADRYADMDDLDAGTILDPYGVLQEIGASVQLSQNVNCDLAVTDARDRWVAVCSSRSGRAFVRGSESSEMYESVSKNWADVLSELNSQNIGAAVGGTHDAPLINATNLLSNGGFEDLPLTGAWVSGGEGLAWAQDTEHAYEGAASVRISGSLRRSQSVPVEPGETIRFSYWADTSQMSTGSILVGLVPTQTSQGWLATANLSPASANDGWTQMVGEWQVPESFTGERVWLRIATAGNLGSHAWIDDVQVQSSSSIGRLGS